MRIISSFNPAEWMSVGIEFYSVLHGLLCRTRSTRTVYIPYRTHTERHAADSPRLPQRKPHWYTTDYWAYKFSSADEKRSWLWVAGVVGETVVVYEGIPVYIRPYNFILYYYHSFIHTYISLVCACRTKRSNSGF